MANWTIWFVVDEVRAWIYFTDLFPVFDVFESDSALASFPGRVSLLADSNSVHQFQKKGAALVLGASQAEFIACVYK